MYDDNFGQWHDADETYARQFYRQVQRASVSKRCKGCGRTVRIMPQYAYCNGCADAIERGGEF
jgi:hypothetical protein